MLILPSQFNQLYHTLWVCTSWSWTVFYLQYHYGVLARWPHSWCKYHSCQCNQADHAWRVFLRQWSKNYLQWPYCTVFTWTTLELHMLILHPYQNQCLPLSFFHLPAKKYAICSCWSIAGYCILKANNPCQLVPSPLLHTATGSSRPGHPTNLALFPVHHSYSIAAKQYTASCMHW